MKFESVARTTLYNEIVEFFNHFKTGLVETSIDLSTGLTREGVSGTASRLNDHTDLNIVPEKTKSLTCNNE